MNTATATTVVYVCTCGRTATTQRPRSAVDKCPFCRTFPMTDDHRLSVWTDESDDVGRCFICDTRPYSHRLFPGDPGYDFIIARATEAATKAGACPHGRKSRLDCLGCWADKGGTTP